MSLGSLVAEPADLQLEALVAQVACHGGSEDEFVLACDVTSGKGFVILHALQGSKGAVLAVAEDDELDAVEAQLLFANKGTGIVDATVVEVVNNLAAAQSLGQGRAVEGPRVNVGVDTEVGGGTVEERLAALPGRAGGDEGVANLVDVALCQRPGTILGFGIDELVEQRRGLCGQ